MEKLRDQAAPSDRQGDSLDRRIRDNQEIDEETFPGGKQEQVKKAPRGGRGHQESDANTSGMGHVPGPGEQIQERAE